MAINNKIWIDFENTPHIPFFKPIIRELQARGFQLVLTARDAFQTCELATKLGFEYSKIGRHYGKNRCAKVLGLFVRAQQLLSFAQNHRPLIGLNHGSRAQILICNVMRIPSVLIMDYEYVKTPPLVRPQWEIVPDVLANCGLHCPKSDRIRKYSGIKEDVYVPEFVPDSSIIDELQLSGKIVVTVRPPATEAHYHEPESEVLFRRFMDRATANPDVKIVLLPRNESQKSQIVGNHPNWFQGSKTVMPGKVVNGLNLIWHSDLVVSGGGTMNREAASLGVPVYSIFRGKIGAVDRSLKAQGRLVIIKSMEELASKIPIVPRCRPSTPKLMMRRALADIVNHVEAISRHYQ